MSHADPVPELVSRLRQSELQEQKLGVVRELSRLGPLACEALPGLLELTECDNTGLREAAAAAVGHMGRDAVPSLRGLVLHEDKYVRRQAVWALGRLGPAAADAVPELIVAVNDADPRTATGATRTLSTMGPAASPAVPCLVEAMAGTNRVICRLAALALSKIGRDALPALLGTLDHDDPFVRNEAAIAVGWLSDDVPEAIDRVARRAAAAGDRITRLNALTALESLGKRAGRVLPALRRLADCDRDPEVREAASRAARSAAGKLPPARAVVGNTTVI